MNDDSAELDADDVDRRESIVAQFEVAASPPWQRLWSPTGCSG
jgi:hypothetical protein